MDSFAMYFLDDAVDKQLKVEYDGGILTNEELHSEEFELTERLCSESQLRFGCCEAATLKFKISNVVIPLAGKAITVTDILESDTSLAYRFGEYKVYSDKPTADRKYRDIVAYDAMYDIIKADVTEWYNTILPNADSTVTLKEFRDSFFAHFGIEQEEVELVNDSMTVEKTIEPSKLSGKTVATAICEINGCFGHIGRNGKFQYIFLKEMVDGLYPSDTLYPADDLFPREAVNVETVNKSHYISAKYEDFVTEKINKLQIRQEEDDIGCIYGTGNNCYVVQDNFLLYGKSTEELTIIAENLYAVISKVYYRPAHVEAKGNPCLQVGDGIRLATTYEIIRTYILQRTLKGIQALRDTYDAEGEQYQSENVNSLHESIIQLKGKTNKLTRTIEEARAEIKDVEEGLSSAITQNAESITADVNKKLESYSTTTEMNSTISAKFDEIRFEVTERTSLYNEEVNTLQGGMEGNIDLSFFVGEATIETMSDKQCLINHDYQLVQDISIPAGTYLFSYEWLRSSGLYIIADVALYDLSIGEKEGDELYKEDLGYAWPETNVWTKETFQFTLTKTSRIRFKTTFLAPSGYEDRVNSLYLTNIALYGTAQSVADAITDVKTELMLQEDQILARVEKDGIISAINLTPETITISADKIDLVGLVTANEFVSKFATIASLNATEANLKTLIAQKASIEQLDSANASIQNLQTNKASITQLNATNAEIQDLKTNKIDASTVKAYYMEVANWTSAGTIKADKIDVNGIASKFSRSNNIEVGSVDAQSLITTSLNVSGGASILGRNISWKSATINGVTINYLGY